MCLFPYPFSYGVGRTGLEALVADFQQLSQRQGAAPPQDTLAPFTVVGSAGLCWKEGAWLLRFLLLLICLLVLRKKVFSILHKNLYLINKYLFTYIKKLMDELWGIFLNIACVTPLKFYSFYKTTIHIKKYKFLKLYVA